jgi:hypothetical protein
VVFDYFTNWVEIFPVPDQTAVTCATKIVDEVISRFGCPLDFHSDQGSNFQSVVFNDLCRLLEIRKTRTSPRHPQCNGKVERFNQTLVRMIKSYLKGEQRDWDLHLGCLAAAYRATPHEATGLTPNLLMLGREVKLPGEIICGKIPTCSNEGLSSYCKYVDNLKAKMQHAHDVARKHLSKSVERALGRSDAKKSICQYKVGDSVWYLDELRSVDESSKLRPLYTGPYIIVQKLGEVDYKIQFDPSGRSRIVHHDKLKPYVGSQKISWAERAVLKAQKPV